MIMQQILCAIALEDIVNGIAVILSEGSDSNDDMFPEGFLPGDLFIITGLFAYPAAMIFYFLYRKEVQ